MKNKYDLNKIYAIHQVVIKKPIDNYEKAYELSQLYIKNKKKKKF